MDADAAFVLDADGSNRAAVWDSNNSAYALGNSVARFMRVAWIRAGNYIFLRNDSRASCFLANFRHPLGGDVVFFGNGNPV